eukprot:3545715-Amphidinium_carterae.2
MLVHVLLECGPFVNCLLRTTEAAAIHFKESEESVKEDFSNVLHGFGKYMFEDVCLNGTFGLLATSLGVFVLRCVDRAKKLSHETTLKF